MLMSSYYFAKKIHYQYNYKERNENKAISTIVLDSSTLQWEDVGEELIVNNNLFDVATIAYHKGIATITGWYDEEETKLTTAFNYHNNKEKHLTITPLFCHYFFGKNVTFSYQIILQYTEVIFEQLTCKVTNVVYPILPPPPRI